MRWIIYLLACSASLGQARISMMEGNLVPLKKTHLAASRIVSRSAELTPETSPQSRAATAGTNEGIDSYLTHLIQMGQRLNRDSKRMPQDEICSLASSIHDWTKQYPQHLSDPALSRSLPNHLDRVRQAAVRVNRACANHSYQQLGAACQHLNNEISRLCKAHGQQSNAWNEQTNTLSRAITLAVEPQLPKVSPKLQAWAEGR
ncbi:MAG: hypothetical protein ACOYKZ_07660 [Chlamydiia bacterium]